MGPVSADVILPLTLVYCPATLPNTFTEIVQLALAESVALLRLMSVVPDVAVSVPPVREPVVQEVERPFGVAINRPVGRVSEKPTPVKAVAVLGFVRVNRKVLVLPRGIGEVRKLFESVGSMGRAQPVIWMLSRYIVAVVAEPEYCPPAAYTRK